MHRRIIASSRDAAVGSRASGRPPLAASHAKDLIDFQVQICKRSIIEMAIPPSREEFPMISDGRPGKSKCAEAKRVGLAGLIPRNLITCEKQKT
jgi:hypothetical protein